MNDLDTIKADYREYFLSVCNATPVRYMQLRGMRPNKLTELGLRSWHQRLVLTDGALRAFR